MNSTILGELALLDVLAEIVNKSGRARPTSAEAVTVADVPVALLNKARRLLETYRDTELSSSSLRQAVARTWN